MPKVKKSHLKQLDDCFWSLLDELFQLEDVDRFDLKSRNLKDFVDAAAVLLDSVDGGVTAVERPKQFKRLADFEKLDKGNCVG